MIIRRILEVFQQVKSGLKSCRERQAAKRIKKLARELYPEIRRLQARQLSVHGEACRMPAEARGL